MVEAWRNEVRVSLGYLPHPLSDLEVSPSFQEDAELGVGVIMPRKDGTRGYLVQNHHPRSGVSQYSSPHAWEDFVPGAGLIVPHRRLSMTFGSLLFLSHTRKELISIYILFRRKTSRPGNAGTDP